MIVDDLGFEVPREVIEDAQERRNSTYGNLPDAEALDYLTVEYGWSRAEARRVLLADLTEL